MKHNIIGNLLVMVSMVFAAIETRYFGYNMLPGSTPELVCDLLSLFMMVCGVSLLIDKKPNE
jgi:hypothetical protein